MANNELTKHFGCSRVFGDSKPIVEVAVLLPKGDRLSHITDGSCWCDPEEHRIDGVAFISHRHSKECAHVSPTTGKH